MIVMMVLLIEAEEGRVESEDAVVVSVSVVDDHVWERHRGGAAQIATDGQLSIVDV